LLFLSQTPGINTRRLRRILGALGFRCQPVKLPGGLGSLALSDAQRGREPLAARVLVQLFTQISGALLGALERGPGPLRRLTGTAQASRQALSAFGLIQLLGELLTRVADLIQIFGNLSGFRGQFVLAPEYVLNQAVFNRHGSNSGQ